MKNHLLVVLVCIQIGAVGQTDQPSASALYTLGMRYMNGYGKPYDSKKAMNLLHQSAAMGNSAAMHSLANQFVKEAQVDSAVYWYKSAATAGNVKSFLNLGKLFKSGLLVTQDFVYAVECFTAGEKKGDIENAAFLAYMNYKGLGTRQNYDKAFELFKKTAEAGYDNSMYFLGLCYRNGYGTNVNTGKAEYWLKLAAGKKDQQAMQEYLNEDLPENMAAVSPVLELQLQKLKGYSELIEAKSSNNYQGDYRGYAVYFDWSKKFVTQIVPLRLNLEKTARGYQGTWQEGESEPAKINLAVSNNKFVFDKSSEYTRIDHYSARTEEVWQFDQAALQLAFLKDSVFLSGAVQFYSPARNEPGKPLQILLTKSVDATVIPETNNMELFPNPARSKSVVQITLSKSSRISFRILDQNGKVIQAEAPRLLPAGIYSYPIQVNRYASGNYIVQLLLDGKLTESKKLVKQ